MFLYEFLWISLYNRSHTEVYLNFSDHSHHVLPSNKSIISKLEHNLRTGCCHAIWTDIRVMKSIFAKGKWGCHICSYCLLGNYFFLFENWRNSKSCLNISIFYLISWFVAAETIQGRKLFKGENYSGGNYKEIQNLMLELSIANKWSP